MHSPRPGQDPADYPETVEIFLRRDPDEEEEDEEEDEDTDENEDREDDDDDDDEDEGYLVQAPDPAGIIRPSTCQMVSFTVAQ